MSTLNSHFTMNYSQPEEYRFSHDSVFLARRVFELWGPRLKPNIKVLDLCAGCGVVGLDFLFHCRAELNVLPQGCDFLEVQKEYASHFLANAKTFGESGIELRFILKNYADCQTPEFGSQYDLILCNPPYFRTHQGKLSPSAFKNRCRFFIDSDFSSLLEMIKHSLAPKGSAFLLMRELTDHGLDALAEAEMILGSRYQIKVVENIRGTPLVVLTEA